MYLGYILSFVISGLRLTRQLLPHCLRHRDSFVPGEERVARSVTHSYRSYRRFRSEFHARSEKYIRRTARSSWIRAIFGSGENEEAFWGQECSFRDAFLFARFNSFFGFGWNLRISPFLNWVNFVIWAAIRDECVKVSYTRIHTSRALSRSRIFCTEQDVSNFLIINNIYLLY